MRGYQIIMNIVISGLLSESGIDSLRETKNFEVVIKTGQTPEQYVQ